MRLDGLKLEKGEFQGYAWPGRYPIYYLDYNNCVLCPDCVNRQQKEYVLDVLADLCIWCIDPSDDGAYFDCRDVLIGANINWEDDTLYCEGCSERIESAYGE